MVHGFIDSLRKNRGVIGSLMHRGGTCFGFSLHPSHLSGMVASANLKGYLPTSPVSHGWLLSGERDGLAFLSRLQKRLGEQGGRSRRPSSTYTSRRSEQTSGVCVPAKLRPPLTPQCSPEV